MKDSSIDVMDVSASTSWIESTLDSSVSSGVGSLCFVLLGSSDGFATFQYLYPRKYTFRLRWFALLFLGNNLVEFII